MLYVKLFGAPSLSWQDAPVNLARRQARALIFRLAADSGPVTRDQLAFLFWPDHSDRKARQNLARLLSYIRGALPDSDLLLANRDHISLNRHFCQSDWRRFNALLVREDESSLAEAVDLYQGPFLSGFDLSGAPEYENWLVGEQGRAERQALAALAGLVDFRAADGDHGQAIEYARRYLAADELAEDMHRRLIALYAAAGDRAAAQRQYEACLTVLERELGVDPLPETQAAYQAALSDPHPAEAVTASAPPIQPKWTVLPSLDLPLIGRDEATQQLEQAYAALGNGGVIFIGGEPGIGKSRLLQDFASAQRDRLVLTGNSHPKSRDLPYQPIAQALRLTLGRLDLWPDAGDIWLAEVSAILPELATLVPDLPQPMPVEPAQAQARLYEALSKIMLHLARRLPLLLCLDDLHWADQTTLDWLEYLAPRLPGSGLCLMATFRSQEARPLASLRQTVRRAGRQAEIILSGLSVEAIADILNQLPAASSRPPVSSPQPLAATIHRATAGNAYFVLETIRTLIENDQLADPPGELPLPLTVQEALESRLGRLDPLARQVIEAAAVLQPDLSLALLERTAGRSEEELVDALDQLTTRQMLRPVGDDFAFQHELLRAVVYENLTAWRRRMLHRRAARTLAELTDAGRRETLAHIAGHYEAAGEIDLAVSYYGQAAQLALDRHAYREAGSLARQALALSTTRDPDPVLLELLADSLTSTGQFAEATSLYRQALAYLPGNNPATAAERWRQANLMRKLGEVLKPQTHFQEAELLYDRALALLGSPANQPLAGRQVWVHIQLDRLDLFYLQARADEMTGLVAAAEPVVRQLNDPYYLSRFYAVATRLRFHQERFRLSAETVRIGRERLANAQATGDPREIAEQQFGQGFILLWAGRLAEVAAPLQAALAAAKELDHSFLQVRCLAYLCILYRLLNQPGQVQRYLARSERLVDSDKHQSYIGVEHVSRAWLAHLQANWGQARQQSLAALAAWEDVMYPFGWLANWILLAIGLTNGDLQQAVEAAAAMLDPGEQRLSGPITAALEAVLQTDEAGDEAALRAALERALDLARAEGYL